MIFHREVYLFARKVDRENKKQANTAVPCLPNTAVFLPSQESSQKATSNQDELFHFSAEGEGD